MTGSTWPRPVEPSRRFAAGADLRPLWATATMSPRLGPGPLMRAAGNRKLAGFAASRGAPAIVRQRFEDLPDEIQGPLGQFTIGDFIRRYGGAS
jgi:hypothetical protein